MERKFTPIRHIKGGAIHAATVAAAEHIITSSMQRVRYSLTSFNTDRYASSTDTVDGAWRGEGSTFPSDAHHFASSLFFRTWQPDNLNSIV